MAPRMPRRSFVLSGLFVVGFIVVLAGLSVTVVNLVSPSATELKFGPLKLTTTHVGLSMVCVGLAYLALLFRGVRERLSNVELFSEEGPPQGGPDWARIGGKTALALLALFVVLLGVAVVWPRRG